MVGLGVGLAVPPGFQLVLLFGLWWVGRRAGRGFNLPIAALLTGITNPLTFVPIYTAYLAVGCGLTGCEIGQGPVRDIVERMAEAGFWTGLAGSWRLLGIIAVGGLPIAAAVAVSGYHFGWYVGDRLRRRRHRRFGDLRSARLDVRRSSQRASER